MDDDKELDELVNLLSRLPTDAMTYTLQDAIRGATSEHELRDYLRHAADLIRDGEPLWTELRAFIEGALRAISYGEDANTALRLKLGHKRPSNRVEEVTIAYIVWDLVNRNDAKVEDAFLMVGKANHKSPETVRDIYYRHKAVIDAELSDKAPPPIPE